MRPRVDCKEIRHHARRRTTARRSRAKCWPTIWPDPACWQRRKWGAAHVLSKPPCSVALCPVLKFSERGARWSRDLCALTEVAPSTRQLNRNGVQFSLTPFLFLSGQTKGRTSYPLRASHAAHAARPEWRQSLTAMVTLIRPITSRASRPSFSNPSMSGSPFGLPWQARQGGIRRIGSMWR